MPDATLRDDVPILIDFHAGTAERVRPARVAEHAFGRFLWKPSTTVQCLPVLLFRVREVGEDDGFVEQLADD